MRPVVIAHRGASGYLPEHTLPAKALAHAMGADYLEQDVVATRDDELVVLHDIHLDRVTDVAERFPGRERDDGRFYVRDFDLAEIRLLRVHERRDEQGRPVYPKRFASADEPFHVHTLAEEIRFIHRLNETTGRTAGIYPEIKAPAWHREEGVDIAPGLLEILDRSGYSRHSDPVYVQCFDVAEVRRLRNELGLLTASDPGWRPCIGTRVMRRAPTAVLFGPLTQPVLPFIRIRFAATTSRTVSLRSPSW